VIFDFNVEMIFAKFIFYSITKLNQ